MNRRDFIIGVKKRAPFKEEIEEEICDVCRYNIDRCVCDLCDICGEEPPECYCDEDEEEEYGE